MANVAAPSQKKPSDENLDEAIKRVYRLYGSDLTAFFSVVHASSKEAAKHGMQQTDWRLFKPR
jgi:hypothetical protein